MSTAVCQGLQSCLEPWPKLTARSLSFSRTAYVSDSDSDKELKEQSNNKKDNNNNNNNNRNDDQQTKNCNINNNKNNQLRSSGGDMGGWSFIQSLSNTSEGPKAAGEEKEQLYIHPLVKKSSLKLSEKSLEMCTESLGSETGSVISEDISIQPLNCVREGSPIRRRGRPNLSSLRQLTGVNSREFPPPLTTIIWSSQVKLKAHREGGRLLMKTVRVPCSQSCFQAEREDGRLRLHLSTNYSNRFEPEFDSQATSAVEEEEEEADEEEEEEEEEEAEAEIEGEEEEDIQEDNRGEGNEVEVEEEEEEEEFDDDVKYWGGGTNGNNNNHNLNVGGEVEMGNYERGRRRSRCHEGEVHRNSLLLIQEPCCWVATS